MPFGVAGVIGGAAKCFYAFVGFDTVATTADEAKNPRRNIPLAIIMALFISFLVYFGISTVLTMAWPYYDQVYYLNYLCKTFIITDLIYRILKLLSLTSLNKLVL